MKKLTSLFLAILMLMSAALAENITPEVVETWYGSVFGQVVTLTLMDDGSYDESGAWNDSAAWTGSGTWTKDADGNLTLYHSDAPMVLEKTDAGLLATLNGTETVLFLMTSEPDASALAADIRHDATLADLQGDWEARVLRAVSLLDRWDDEAYVAPPDDFRDEIDVL